MYISNCDLETVIFNISLTSTEKGIFVGPFITPILKPADISPADYFTNF